MPMEENEILEKLFSLADNPFDPRFNLARNFDFRQRRVGLMNELEIFRILELKEYFHKLGTFDKAINTIQKYIENYGYPASSTYPPTILIHGSTKAGRSTTANYVADYIREINKPDIPNLGKVRISTNNYGGFLLQVKLELESHINAHPDAPHYDTHKNSFATYNPSIDIKDPSELVLTQLFSKFEYPSITPLILIIEPIEYNHEQWIYKFYKIFSKINIIPIYITSDSRLIPLFSYSVKKEDITGVYTEIDGLDKRNALELLETRLSMFRLKDTVNEQKGIFPFEQESINQPYSSGSKLEIGRLLKMFRMAFNAKIKELEALSLKDFEDSADKSKFLINGEHFKDSVVTQIRNIFENKGN